MLKRKRATIIVKTSKGILVGKPWFIWSFRLIGGGVKRREDYLDAGKRELFEETGIKEGKLKFLFDFKERLQEHKVYYIKIKNNLEMKMNWENKNVQFVNKSNFRNFKLNRYTKKILARYFS